MIKEFGHRALTEGHAFQTGPSRALLHRGYFSASVIWGLGQWRRMDFQGLVNSVTFPSFLMSLILLVVTKDSDMRVPFLLEEPKSYTESFFTFYNPKYSFVLA